MATLTRLLLLAALITPVAMTTHCQHLVDKERGHVTWNCSHLGFPEFRYVDVVPEGVQAVDLSHNRIEVVTHLNMTCSDTKRCESCLQRLRLDNNQLTTVRPDAFEKLVCLEELDLSYNQLTGKTIDAQTFQGLHKLRVLRLDHNPLGFLPDFAVLYTDLLALQHLDLSHGQLTALDSYSIDDLGSLLTLDLSHNLLTQLPPDVFRGLFNLEEINLADNRLETINTDTFADLVFLKTLDLSNNHLSHLPNKSFTSLRSLRNLSLRANRFLQLPYNALRMVQSLEILDVSENPFKELKASPNPRRDRLPVTSLTIDETPLREVGQSALSTFPLLRTLRMTHNRQLETVHATTFEADMTSIEEVYLSDNALTFLPESLLPWTKLRVLSLENNPWNCDCKVKWMVESHFFNQTFSCQQPSKFRGRNMLELSPSDLTCPRSMVVFWATGGALGGLVLVGMLVLTLLSAKADPSSRLGRWLRPVKGAYVSVFTKEVDGEETVMIAKTEEEVTLRETRDNDYHDDDDDEIGV